jgi:hypothetical protein
VVASRNLNAEKQAIDHKFVGIVTIDLNLPSGECLLGHHHYGRLFEVRPYDEVFRARTVNHQPDRATWTLQWLTDEFGVWFLEERCISVVAR